MRSRPERFAFALNGSVGFPNTLNNMYNAWKDRTPLVVARSARRPACTACRDAFEEWDDYLSPFRELHPLAR